jgi:hypothetical protein
VLGDGGGARSSCVSIRVVSSSPYLAACIAHVDGKKLVYCSEVGAALMAAASA